MAGGSSNSGASSPVFGSRSPSPAGRVAQIQNTHTQPPAPEYTHVQQPGSHQALEGSDVPHLVRTHETLGYRAGLSDGKDHAGGVQAAFDDGYPLGAALGLRVGWLLRRLAEPGVLSLHKHGEPAARNQDQQNTAYTLQDAVHELSIAKLVAEFEQLGVLNKDVHKQQNKNVSDELLEKLPAIAKWSEIARGNHPALAKIT